MFQEDATEKIKMHIGTEYFARINPKEETITVEPMSDHIKCKTKREDIGIQRPSQYG